MLAAMFSATMANLSAQFNFKSAILTKDVYQSLFRRNAGEHELLVVGWITLFSAEFHRSGDRPGTFLLTLIHALADLAALGALLPLVTAAWRRVVLPYLALLAVAIGDALAVGQRALGGHPGVVERLQLVHRAGNALRRHGRA